MERKRKNSRKSHLKLPANSVCPNRGLSATTSPVQMPFRFSSSTSRMAFCPVSKIRHVPSFIPMRTW
ncbi:MAG: hypothetical protein A4E67_01484 [Syntrophaceae bacterium PtaB.Bin038]|nr:MAG: hypothetical protein A4E67_01484 [Syntrophaceae bacterium PtaB.Bin038]